MTQQQSVNSVPTVVAGVRFPPKAATIDTFLPLSVGLPSADANIVSGSHHDIGRVRSE
jgi:hypothetical protein